MSENNCIPHIRLPRSLLDNDLWINLPLGYREVFLVILDHICFRPQKFDDHGNVVELLIGQVCTTIREITKWLGKFGDKNIVERAIKKFILYQFVSQEVRHSKSILTITHKDTYELIKRATETRSETILRQNQDKIETETKNEKNEKNEEYISREALTEKVIGFDFPGSISHEVVQEKIIIETPKTKAKKSKATVASEEYKASLVERRVNIHTSEEEHKKLIQKEGIENTEKIYDHLSEWKKSISLKNPKMAESHSDFYRIKKWVIKAYQEENSKKIDPSSSIEENKKYALLIQKDYESKTYRIDILSKGIEFTPNTGQTVPKAINYSENGFKEQIKNSLTTYKFQRKKNAENIKH